MDHDPYWDHANKTILVPVKITYHPPTDVLVKFDTPTATAIEKAIRTDRDRTNKLIEIKSFVTNAILTLREPSEEGDRHAMMWALAHLNEAVKLLLALETT